ncbi:MAG: HD domain-containing protein [Clostridia bacterium]|nr:HD domain-containing protein [Clostridia bacterium]
MARDALRGVGAYPEHPRYAELIARTAPLYDRDDDVRSPFMRDYTRILHSTAFRRLKHKTQVFFNPRNDHVCTRMEHVMHVESVSHTIAGYLGLNTELTQAIATGHDIGHAPFGHQGEQVLEKLSQEVRGRSFWHERNGVRFADHLELLEDDRLRMRNLHLTYAVRDGIVSHCGEVDEQALIPRENWIQPEEIEKPGEMQPATWEGCVVKLADKISYLGRDISDAIRLGIIKDKELRDLRRLGEKYEEENVNTTVLIHKLILDVCENTTLETGIRLSDRYRSLMDEIKRFNYEHIYLSERLAPFRRYAELILRELFGALCKCYKGESTLPELWRRRAEHPLLYGDFCRWLAAYVTLDLSAFEWGHTITQNYDNEKVYGDLSREETYIDAVLDFLAGMTDNYAIDLFEDLISI